MEYELERTALDGFEILQDTALLREETLEMIVPDACPDILRIIETDGTVLLHQKSAQSGKAELEGSFKLEVLYLPDGEEGVRQLPVIIPFSCTLENKAITPETGMTASLRLYHADARLLNPRKILARGEAVVEMTLFAPVHEELSQRMSERTEEHLEQKTEICEFYLTDSVTEQEFEIRDQMQISSGKPAALEILKCRAELCRGESKLIGNKLIYKGDVRLCVVYRGTDQGIHTTGGELPYSQIMEVSGAGESADCDLILTVTDLDSQLEPGGEERTIEISVNILAQAVIRENRRLEILTDAYSTSEPVICDWRQLAFQQKRDLGHRTQNARELWETAGEVQEILDSRLKVGQLTSSREGDKLVVTVQAELDVLYLGSDGGLYAAQRQVSVPCNLELPEQCSCFCRCEEVGEAYSAPAAGGIESRFALDFSYCALTSAVTSVLETVQPGEEAEEAGDLPSLVLRAMEAGEQLWDLAKAYHTTTADIISANELSDEDAAAGRLLLIPRKR